MLLTWTKETEGFIVIRGGDRGNSNQIFNNLNEDANMRSINSLGAYLLDNTFRATRRKL